MTTLRIHRCGPAMSVQDAGRFGTQRYGISGSGVMDHDAYHYANALVGAPCEAAVLEFAALGGQFSVDAPALIAVTGGACSIDVDGARVAPWTSVLLQPGAKLNIGPLEDAVYGYIAVAGGIDVPLFMGSRSTHDRAGIGGHAGRVLRAGDVLRFFAADNAAARALAEPPRRASGPIRVVAGPQDDYFTADAWERFLGTSYSVSTRRDRMGMVLEGPPLDHARGYNIVSDAVAFGSIQVPGSGSPIVLLADRQTTGGYPKIATVISSDLARLAQTRSGDPIRFARVSVEEAEALARAQDAKRRRTLSGIAPISSHADLSSARLLSVNLVSGVSDAGDRDR